MCAFRGVDHFTDRPTGETCVEKRTSIHPIHQHTGCEFLCCLFFAVIFRQSNLHYLLLFVSGTRAVRTKTRSGPCAQLCVCFCSMILHFFDVDNIIIK